MGKSAAKLSRAELRTLGPAAAEEAVRHDLLSGVPVEGGARFAQSESQSIVLARVSPDHVLRMVRVAKSGTAG